MNSSDGAPKTTASPMRSLVIDRSHLAQSFQAASPIRLVTATCEKKTHRYSAWRCSVIFQLTSDQSRNEPKPMNSSTATVRSRVRSRLRVSLLM